MRFVTFRPPGSVEDRVGIVADNWIHALKAGVRLVDLLADPDGLATTGEQTRRDPVEVFDLAAVRLRAPVPRPPSVRDFYAFEQHVKSARQGRGLAMEPDWYELPVFYFTSPAAVIGPEDQVPVPPGCAELDFELEVACVVGPGGRNLRPTDARKHIAGFMVMNDWSARDIQRREMKLGLGPAKGKDFATSLGPWLVTPDELSSTATGHSYNLAMAVRVNGRELGRASLADVYWSFEEMLAYASRGTELLPGDVIGSGTCGNGCLLELSLVHGEAAYPWLKAGDVVELEVARLGRLKNRVVPGPPLFPLRP